MNVVVIQAPDHSAQVPFELCPAYLVRGEHHSSRLLTAGGGDDDPIANEELIPVGSEVIDAPGIPEANADHALRRRAIVETENGITFAAAALADLLAQFEAALEALASASAGLIER
jgi:hypothetical protein